MLVCAFNGRLLLPFHLTLITVFLPFHIALFPILNRLGSAIYMLFSSLSSFATACDRKVVRNACECVCVCARCHIWSIVDNGNKICICVDYNSISPRLPHRAPNSFPTAECNSCHFVAVAFVVVAVCSDFLGSLWSTAVYMIADRNRWPDLGSQFIRKRTKRFNNIARLRTQLSLILSL